MRKAYILFGEMGGGKTYHAQKSFVNGMVDGPKPEFLEGDSVIPAEMLERVLAFKPLTPEMVTSYVKNNLYPAIMDKFRLSPSVVVSQALYSDANRRELIMMLQHKDVEVTMVWIKPGFWRNLKQIWSRPNGLKWVLYWLINKPFFQKPTHHHIVVGD